MKNKIAGIFLCIILVFSNIIVIIPGDFKVKAEGAGSGNNLDIGLDFQYIWNIADNLSKVIFNYPSNLIPKGRAFGSWGEQHVALNIIQDEMSAIGLDNPGLSPQYIEQLENIDSLYDDNSLDSLITKIDINSQGIIFRNTSSQNNYTLVDFHIRPRWEGKVKEMINEIFPWLGLNYNESRLNNNFSYSNITIKPRPMNVSDWLDVFFCSILDDMVNQSFDNYTSLMAYVLTELEKYSGVYFDELDENPEYVQNYSWYDDLNSSSRSGSSSPENIVYIEENPHFNPNATFPSYYDTLIQCFLKLKIGKIGKNKENMRKSNNT